MASAFSKQQNDGAVAGETVEDYRDVRPHRFFVQLNRRFRDQYFSFTGHFVANPATIFAKKKNTRSIRPKCKKKQHEKYNSFESTKKRTVCPFKCWLTCQLASSEALLSKKKKKNIDDPTPSWCAVPFFCVLSHKNDIRQNCVISMFSGITSEEHVR